MPFHKMLNILPPFYSDFFPDFFKESIPTEDLSTCDDCAICPKEEAPQVPGLTYFSPDVKCCTYYPALPNYLVGAILADQSPAAESGRQRVKEIIKNRLGVTPHGLLPTEEYSKKYRRLRVRGFGRFKSLLCPFFMSDTGRCAIWTYRKSVCISWYCVYVAGQFGHNFWTAFREYLAHVEDTLAKYALQKMDARPDMVLAYTFASKSDPDTLYPFQDKRKELDADLFHEFLWAEWVGREEAFYLQSFEAVSALSREEFEGITGVRHGVLLDHIKNKYREMINPRLPSILKLSPEIKITELADGTFAVYSSITSFIVPAVVNDILMMFDGGRTNQSIIKELEEEREVKIGQDLLLALYQNGALVS